MPTAWAPSATASRVGRLPGPERRRISPETGASRRPFVHLTDLGLAGLAYQFRDDPRMLAFAEHELGPLLLHDDRCGTDLVAVLAAFLDSGGNKAGAAKRCGIARPTLYERLSQIQQVLGANLHDAGRRTTLHAALLIRQLGSDKPDEAPAGPPGLARWPGPARTATVADGFYTGPSW